MVTNHLGQTLPHFLQVILRRSLNAFQDASQEGIPPFRATVLHLSALDLLFLFTLAKIEVVQIEIQISQYADTTKFSNFLVTSANSSTFFSLVSFSLFLEVYMYLRIVRKCLLPFVIIPMATN
jgi:hypothetical protein